MLCVVSDAHDLAVGPSWGDFDIVASSFEFAHDVGWHVGFDARSNRGSVPGGRTMRGSVRERYRWWEFETHPEWIEPHHTAENRILCYAAGIPGQTRVVYIPGEAIAYVALGQARIKALEPGLTYQAYYYDPKTGDSHHIEPISGDEHGNYQLPQPPTYQDWVVVLDR